jgi:hypothetical protein
MDTSNIVDILIYFFSSLDGTWIEHAFLNIIDILFVYSTRQPGERKCRLCSGFLWKWNVKPPKKKLKIICTIFFKKRKKTNRRRRLVRGNFTTKIA